MKEESTIWALFIPAQRKTVCSTKIIPPLEHLSLVFASMSVKGQMLSASLMVCIQKSHPFCLPAPSHISHSLARSLCDFVCSLTCSFHQPVDSFLGCSYRGASPRGLLPPGHPRQQPPFFSAESGATPSLVWSLSHLLAPTSVSCQPGLSASSASSHPSDKWVKISPHLALQAPPQAEGCNHSLLWGKAMAERGFVIEGSWAQGRGGNAEMGRREKMVMRSCPLELPLGAAGCA